MFSTMQEVREANKAAGRFWFSESTTRFFNSRVETELIAGRWFVTSESNGTRRYTVREVLDDGARIETVGEFMAHGTLAEALAHLAIVAYDAGRADEHRAVCEEPGCEGFPGAWGVTP